MSKEKQSRQDLADKKIQALIGVVQRLLDENSHILDLSIGTLEVIKQMPGYDDAMAKVKLKAIEDSKKKEDTTGKKLEL